MKDSSRARWVSIRTDWKRLDQFSCWVWIWIFGLNWDLLGLLGQGRMERSGKEQKMEVSDGKNRDCSKGDARLMDRDGMGV